MKTNFLYVLLVLFCVLFVKMFFRDLSIAESLVGLSIVSLFGFYKYMETMKKEDNTDQFENRIKNLEKALALNSLSRRQNG